MAQAVRRFACYMTVKAIMSARMLSGRAADPDPVTAMRIPETADAPRKSGAVSRLIGASSLRPGDVDRTNERSTPRIPVTRGYRASTTAISTTTTRTTTTERVPSADDAAADPAEFSFADLVAAYFDCRRTKRNTHNALGFEADLERNLRTLYEDLADNTYRPGRSICFVITRPRPREVWAADFRDRVVHHLLYNRISPRYYAAFIVGTHGTRAACVDFYRHLAAGQICISLGLDLHEPQIRARFWMERASRLLRGKNLACWCPLDQPCHADVLLEMANPCS